MFEKRVVIRSRKLPHWRVENGAYFVTFRLNDSLPAHVVRELGRRAQAARTEEAKQRLRARFERYLDAGYGSSLLARPRCGDIVLEALRHFDGDRYELGTSTVMPNHVHTIVRPESPFDLDGIVESWRKFTAREINKLVGREGPLWYPEPYDHWVRDEHELERARLYILENPRKAGLVDWKFVIDPNMRGMLDKVRNGSNE